MKFFRTFIKVFIFIMGTLISLWIFTPWGKIGEYAVLSAEKAAASKGFNTKHAAIDGSWQGPTVKINDFSSKMVFGGGEFKTLNLSPSFIQSIIQFSPVVSVSFTGGRLALPGGNAADIGSGNAEISLKNGILFISKLKSAGELSFDGNIAIDVNAARIDNADLIITPPARLEQSLSSMRTMLPLIQESNGQWRIKREKNNG